MAAAAPVTVTVLSWNIQILGEAKSKTELLFLLLAKLVAESGADVVAIQEVVNAAGDKVLNFLIEALKTYQQPWEGVLVAARTEEDAPDRDGYLFLWRKDMYKALLAGDGTRIAGHFEGNFPSNIASKRGRRPGYVGLTPIAGPQIPFIVAGYHAPTFATDRLGSAPALAFEAFLKEFDQFRHYSDGGARKPFSAWFLCADFNMDSNAADATGSNFDDWYKPLLAKLDAKEATRGNTLLMTTDAAKKAPPAAAAGYAVQSLDNILGGPKARVIGGEVLNTIAWMMSDNKQRALAESFLAENRGKNQNAATPSDLQTCHYFIRTFVSDHLPVKVQLRLSP